MFQCVAPEFLKKKTGGEIRLEELKKEAKRIGFKTVVKQRQGYVY